MKTKIFYPWVIAAIILVSGCNKENELSFDACEKLSAGLATSSAPDVRLGVNRLIEGLESAEYSGPNLYKLAEKISGDCGITAAVTCFNCHHTFPMTTEITVNYSVAGTAMQKVLVVTHTSANKMTFSSMHN